jgi:hypothetical protein
MVSLPFLTILLVVVASAVGTLLWWIVGRLGAKPWLQIFLMLLGFGLVMFLVKIA